jgi:uncharacterized Fe-S cluster protein YjdI
MSDQQPKIHEYENDDIVVEWRPALCQHGGACARGLPGVFRPRLHPWIMMGGADTETIAEQVGRCPSGALQIRRK